MPSLFFPIDSIMAGLLPEDAVTFPPPRWDGLLALTVVAVEVVVLDVFVLFVLRSSDEDGLKRWSVVCCCSVDLVLPSADPLLASSSGVLRFFPPRGKSNSLIAGRRARG